MKPYQILKIYVKHYFLKRKLKKEGKTCDYSQIKTKSNSVLIIDNRIPEYNKDSGSRRLFELIKLMINNNVNVFLLADLKEYKYRSDYIQTFKELGVHVYEPCLDENNQLLTKERFIKKIAPHIHFAWLHRPTIFDKYHRIIKKANHQCKCVFDMVDFHYLRLKREYELYNDESLKKQAESFLTLEIDNCKKADTIIAISENDKQVLKQYYDDDSKIEVIGNVHQFMKKTDDFLPFNERNKLFFLGGFYHEPNVDAVLHLKNEIMPLVWKENPEIEVVIIGSYPPQEILDLDSNKFEVKGFVDDVSKFFRQCRLFVAPLRYGAGVKGKIGQSFEWSLPVITTDVGIEGFDVSPYYEDMIANTPETIASKIVELYSNENLWSNISNHTEEFLKPYSLKDINTTLKSVLKA